MASVTAVQRRAEGRLGLAETANAFAANTALRWLRIVEENEGVNCLWEGLKHDSVVLLVHSQRTGALDGV